MSFTCTQKYTLKIKIIDETMEKYYKEFVVLSNGNAGYDIFVTEDIILEPNKESYIEIKSGIQCEMVVENVTLTFKDNVLSTKTYLNNVSYLLLPRSSISKYNIVMCNSIGLIDSSYRGEILARIYNFNNKPIEFKKGDRLFQIVAPNLSCFAVEIVNKLSLTERDTNAFGSTGK